MNNYSYSIQTLTPENEQLLQSKKTLILNAFPHLEKANEVRLRGFFLSRLALIKALEQQGIEADFNQLQLKNYSTLQEYPQLKISISHSKLAGAAIISKNFTSIGIDIEPIDREIAKGAERHILHENDVTTLNILEIWCVKEAAYKYFGRLAEINAISKVMIQGDKVVYQEFSANWSLSKEDEHNIAFVM